MKCKCGRRWSATGSVTSIRCKCGETVAIKPGDHDPAKAARRKRALQQIAICQSNRCGHWGDHQCDGAMLRGCGLLTAATGGKRKPCQTFDWLLSGGGCVAPNPLFPPADIALSHRAAPYLTEDELLAGIRSLFSKLAPLRIRRIVGVPRSGMAVASQLALMLSVPLHTMTPAGPMRLMHGLRLRAKAEDEGGATIVVEDSTASGRSMREARKFMQGQPGDILYAAVFATESGAKAIDHWGEILPLPHYFSWNLWGNNHLLSGWKVGTDFDGILCADCPIPDDDDGPRYRAWMKSARPILRPGPHPIPVIITARLERYRELTEQWLAKHSIRYGKLVMGPWGSLAERRQSDIGLWKLQQAKQHGCLLFVESDWHQAQTISREWDNPVICPEKRVAIVRGKGPQWHETLRDIG